MSPVTYFFGYYTELWMSNLVGDYLCMLSFGARPDLPGAWIHSQARATGSPESERETNDSHAGAKLRAQESGPGLGPTATFHLQAIDSTNTS